MAGNTTAGLGVAAAQLARRTGRVQTALPRNKAGRVIQQGRKTARVARRTAKKAAKQFSRVAGKKARVRKRTARVAKRTAARKGRSRA